MWSRYMFGAASVHLPGEPLILVGDAGVNLRLAEKFMSSGWRKCSKCPSEELWKVAKVRRMERGLGISV